MNIARIRGMDMKTLLVTIAIGDTYLQTYNTLFRKSQEVYASQHGYDFKVITTFLDENRINHAKGAISFNKILVCSQDWSNQYDFILFIDADILIHEDAPPLHSFIDYGDCIGIVDEYSQPTLEKRIALQKQMGWETSGTDYYKLAGFDIVTNKVLNTGVLVLQPKKHADFLKQIYDKHVETSKHHPRGYHYEQSCIGYELMKNNKFVVLPNPFNAVWALQKMDLGTTCTLDEFFKNNYFTHFAGNCDFAKIPYLRRSD